MVGGGSVDDFELGEEKALEGTRHLVVFDISKRLLKIEQEIDLCDTECDRALGEIWRLLHWIEGRLTRNGAFSDGLN
jgi:hypothetical protein